MRLKISDISVPPRIRQEEGDTGSLNESIEKHGLLHPILVDEQYNLIAGYRRLQVCRKLGWTHIEAIVVETGGDRLKKLEIELQENLGRRDLTDGDLEAYRLRRAQMEAASHKKISFWQWLKKLFTAVVALFKRGEG